MKIGLNDQLVWNYV